MMWRTSLGPKVTIHNLTEPAMRRQLGRVALMIAVLAWVILLLAPVLGGLDPAVAQLPGLQAATMGALGMSLVALLLAVFALVRGQQRATAAFGLGMSLLFLLHFTGLGFALVGLMR